VEKREVAAKQLMVYLPSFTSLLNIKFQTFAIV